MIKGVHSAIIWTEEMGRLLPFYRDTLGLKPEMDTPEFVVFAADGAGQLCLGVHSDVKGQSRDPNRVMVDLGVDNCQAEYQRLHSKGVEFLREPSTDVGDPHIVATFKDPDGNLVQLIEEPEASGS